MIGVNAVSDRPDKCVEIVDIALSAYRSYHREDDIRRQILGFVRRVTATVSVAEYLVDKFLISYQRKRLVCFHLRFL